MANNEIEEVVVNGNTYKFAFKDLIANGTLKLKNSNIDSSTTPASDAWGNSIRIEDKNGNRLAYIQPVQRTDGRVEIMFQKDNTNNPDGKVIVQGVDIAGIVPQAKTNSQLVGTGIDVLDGSLDNNRLYLVGIAQSSNCPPQATSGMGLRMMYYTGDDYWTNIVYFYHLDGGQMYFNAYHKATGAWQGWKKGFKSGAIYLGQYSANTTIDVSDLGATSVDQFLAVSQSLTFSNDPARSISGYFVEGVGFTAPTMTLSNGILTVTRAWARSAVNNDNPGTTRNVPYRVYYVGDIETR